MSYFVRKISQSKWKSDSDEIVIQADALTSCLRTTGNTLSFWQIDDLSKVDEAKLAIAASNSNLDTFDIVIFSLDEMNSFGAPVRETRGGTACVDLADTHRDLSELNSDHLMTVSHAVLKKVKNNSVERVTLGKLKGLMKAAAANDRLDLDMLSDKVKAKIGLSVPEKIKCTCGFAGS